MEDVALKLQGGFGDFNDRNILVSEKAGDSGIFGKLINPGAVDNAFDQLLLAPVDQHLQLARKNRLVADKPRDDNPIATPISQAAPWSLSAFSKYVCSALQ